MTQPEQFYSLGDDDTIRRHIRIERENGKKIAENPMVEGSDPKRGVPLLSSAGGSGKPDHGPCGAIGQERKKYQRQRRPGLSGLQPQQKSHYSR